MAYRTLCDANEALSFGPGAGKPLSSLHHSQYTFFVHARDTTLLLVFPMKAEQDALGLVSPPLS
jgi:hypothetical protein